MATTPFSIISQFLGENNRTRIEAPGTGITILPIDVTNKIEPKYSVEVTQHPVETGSNISDHIKIKNIEILLEGYVSETPINLAATARGLVTSAAGIVGSRIGGSVGGGIGAAVGGIGASLFINSDDPAASTRKALIALLNSRQHFKITAPSLALDSNDNFVLTSLSFPREKSTGRGLKFTATIQQIQFAESAVIDVSRLSAAVSSSASKQKDQGKKATKTETNPTNASIAKKIFKYKGQGIL